jgi:hypothetical protein
VVGVDGGVTTVQTPPASDGLVEILENTIGTPAGGLFGKPAYAVVVVNAGKVLAAVGMLALAEVVVRGILVSVVATLVV